jgi:rhodanese-related sulfurtransferase
LEGNKTQRSRGMKTRTSLLFSILIVIGLLLGACSQAATTTVAPTDVPPEPTEAPVEVGGGPEPTEAPEPTPEPEVEEAADLDTAFNTFLADMDHYNVTSDMAALNEELASDNPPFLLDVRQPEELEEKGHIEGAVNVPLRELGQNLDLLPSFDTRIVVYCGSGWRAGIAMTALQTMGWTNTYSLGGGSYGAWVEQGYQIVEGATEEAMALDAASPDPALVAEFDAMLSSIPEGWGVVTAENLNVELAEKPELILIDVRKVAEVEEFGYVDAPNVQFITLEDFIAQKGEWPAKDAEIVTYCKAGHRGTIAMSILWTYGFENVRNLKGGYTVWQADGYGTVGGGADLDTAFSTFLANMDGYNVTGDMAALNEELASDTPPFLLDVRQPDELEEKGHIEGAVNIPLRELGQNLDLLPSFDTRIVVYCGSGWRAGIAMTALQTMGWTNTYSLGGGSYGAWVEQGYPTVEGAAPEAEMLNGASPDPALVAEFDAMLSSIPEGWGVVTAENLNVELAEKPELILIDVRKEAEVEEFGYVDAPNVQFITLEDFIAQKNEWPAKDAEIVTYCKAGHRGTIAMSILWTYGFENVRNLKGGYTVWQADGYGTVGGGAGLDTAFSTFLANMDHYNVTSDMAALNEELGTDTPPFLLDVRQPEELEEKGHIEGAVNIPLRELGKNLDLLPSFDTRIVVYCGSGWRAATAMTALQTMGWTNTHSLGGGSYGAWLEQGYPFVEGVAEEAMVLDAASPDPALVAEFDAMLSSIPEGWGVITVDNLNAELVEDDSTILIDVRTPGEIEELGVIDAPNVSWIQLEEFINLKGEWPANMDAEIVTYCKAGHRGVIAMTILWTYD